MKNSTLKALISLVLFSIFGFSSLHAQNIGINTDGTSPDNSAMLDIKSANMGLLVPRISLSSLTDASTIATPANSLLIFNTNASVGLGKGYYYNNGTTVSPDWVPLLNKNNSWLTTGNSGTTPGTHYLGTTDSKELYIKTNGTERMKFSKDGGTSEPNITITSVADTSSGLKIKGGSTSNGSILELMSNSTAGISEDYGKGLYVNKYGVNTNPGHMALGVFSSVANSGVDSRNIGVGVYARGAYQTEGLSTSVEGVNNGTEQHMTGSSIWLDANGNSNGASTTIGSDMMIFGAGGRNIGERLYVNGGDFQAIGIDINTISNGTQPGIGVNATVSGDHNLSTGEQSFGGYFSNSSTSSRSDSWAYGIYAATQGNSVGVNCSAFLTAVNAPSGKNYALIIPHYNALQGWGGWVGIGTIKPERLLQVDGTVRIGGENNIGRIELQGQNDKLTTLVANQPVSNIKFLLPATAGNVNDVLLVNSIVADTTILAWAPSPTLSYWSLNGNASTNPASNFIGTTDNKDFVIKVNGTEKIHFYAGGQTQMAGGLYVMTSLGVGTNTPSGRMEVTGGNINFNVNSNFPTNINTGTSTGAVSIGNSAAGAITIASASTVNVSTGATLNATTTLGTTGAQVFASSTANSDKIAIVPQSATATNTFTGTITSSDLTANRQWTLPDAGGNFLLASGPGSTTTLLHGNAAGLPTWSAVALTTDVTGTLPIGNGGTGTASAPTQGGVIYASSTSAMASTAAGTTGQVLTSNGSSAPTWLTLGGVASIAASTAAINTTETKVVQWIIPANTLQVGTTFRIIASGTCTSSATNASNFRVRIGTTGTNTDAIASLVAPTAANTGTNIPFSVTELVTVRTTGATGTALGSGCLNNQGVTGVSNAVATVGQTTTAITVNTTVQNYITLFYQSAAATTTSTFYNATIEVVKP
ncbi:MAG: hypothetical protein WCL06_08160 [Bacteroidota bacterium]